MNDAQLVQWLQSHTDTFVLKAQTKASPQLVEWNVPPDCKYHFIIRKLQGIFQTAACKLSCDTSTLDAESSVWCAGPWNVTQIQYFRAPSSVKPSSTAVAAAAPPCSWKFIGIDAFGQSIELCTQPGSVFRIWCERFARSCQNDEECLIRGEPIPALPPARASQSATVPSLRPEWKSRAYLSKDEYEAFVHAYDDDV